MAKLFLYSLGIWLLLVVLAIVNGTIRNSLITPKVGEYAGHVISTVIFMCVILLVTYLFLSSLKIEYSKTDLLLVGALWLALTIIFEFVFGHYVVGHPWERLLADYNIFKGRVWILVLLTTFIAPFLVGSLLKK